MELNMERFWQRFNTICKQLENETGIMCGLESRTYGQLLQQINEICARLISSGCKPGDQIAIDQVGTLNRVSSFLAVMKYGCNYVHVDSRFSPKRKRELLDQLKIDYLITLEGSHSFDRTVCVNLSDNHFASTYEEISDRLSTFSITYCSGIKGDQDLIIHSSDMFMNWLYFNEEILKLPFSKNMTILGPTGTELLFPIWLGSLMNGGTVSFVAADSNDFELIPALREIKDGVVALPIEYLGDLARLDTYEYVFQDTLETMVTFGEHIFEATRFKGYLAQKNMRWYNYYGFPRLQLISSITKNAALENQHIGRGIINTKTHVLNASLKPALIGVMNRLYVSGIGAAKVVQSGGTEKQEDVGIYQNEVLFKTDYDAKWNEQGTLTLSNHRNRNAMIDGIELNLDELGDLLLMHPSVTECWVDLRGGRKSHMYILGYVVMTSDNNTIEELHHYMSELLPEGVKMSFVQMPRLPRNNKGDVDCDCLRARNDISTLELMSFESILRDQNEIEEVRLVLVDDVENFRSVHYKHAL